MRFRLEMPYVSAQVKHGTLARWHAAVGDRLEFGDDLFDLEITEIEVIVRPTKRHFVKRSLPGDLRSMSPVQLKLRVTASDAGYLRQILVATGEPVASGNVVGAVTTTAGEALDDSSGLDSSPVFRVVVNAVESEWGALSDEEGAEPL